MTWEDVSAEAYKIGRDWGDRTWRLDALSPTAPGEYRLLAEFCRYVEEKHGMSIGEPIDSTDIGVLAGAEVALQRWCDLRDLVATKLAASESLSRTWGNNLWGRYQAGRTPDGHTLGWEMRFKAPWPALRDTVMPAANDQDERWQLGGLIAAPVASWIGDVGYSDPCPAFGSGVSVRIDGDWPDGLREGQPLRVACEKQEFKFGITSWSGGVTGRVFRTLFLEALEQAGSTIQDQADHVVRWAHESLATLQETQP